jgi:hypothetical protein
VILDLLQRLAEQQAAITAAQAALHRLVELGVCGAVDAAQAIPPPEAAERVLGPLAAPESAICAAPDCSTPVPPQARPGRDKVYCSPRCRSRVAARRIRARKAEQEAAADRAQTVAILEQNASEGYSNLQWGNGHAAT